MGVSAYLLQLRKTITNGYIATLCHAEWLKPCHSLRALFAAGLITRKVGVSVDAREGLYSMREAFIAIGLSEPFSSRSKYATNCLQ